RWPAGDGVQGVPRLGLRVSGPARPRRQRERDRDPAPQARERRLGARRRDSRAFGTQLHRPGLTAASRTATLVYGSRPRPRRVRRAIGAAHWGGGGGRGPVAGLASPGAAGLA